MSPPPFRIAIVGGGIGGLYCALAIHHHCTQANVNFRIDVYEQAAEYKDIGAGIGLRVDAAQLLHNVGLGERLNEIAGQGAYMCYRRYDNSKEIVDFPYVGRGEVRTAPCARSELLELLKGAIEERKAARLHTGKTCLRVEDLKDQTVRLHFTDTTTTTASLLIAADGIHSKIRHQFASDNATFSGFIAYRGIVPMSSLSPWPFPSHNVAWLAKHRHFLTYSMSNDKALNVVAFVTKGETQVAGMKESWTSTCERRELEEDFEGFDGFVQEVIGLMPRTVSKWRINDHERLYRWHYMDGKVMLLGDAAHAATPHLGAGGGLAISDGWVLGRAIGEYLSKSNEALKGLRDVGALYEAARMKSAHEIQVASRLNGDSIEMQTPEMVEKSYDECCEIVGEGIRSRLGMSHGDDTDEIYEKAKEGMSCR